MMTSRRLARQQPLSKLSSKRVRPRRDFAAMEERRMRAVDLFEQGVRPAEIARQLGVASDCVAFARRLAALRQGPIARRWSSRTAAEVESRTTCPSGERADPGR